MIRNARAGIFLVVLALAFFLDLRVAFWVAVGIPVSVLASLVALWLDDSTRENVQILGSDWVSVLVADGVLEAPDEGG